MEKREAHEGRRGTRRGQKATSVGKEEHEEKEVVVGM
jgi:hypothetical protein